MRKILFAALCFFSSALFALYSGNPDQPALIEEGFFFNKENLFSVKAGYERDWVFDRNMKAVNKIKGRMTDFSYIADQGVLTLNLVNRLEVYGSAGAVRFSATNIPMSTLRNEYDTHNQFVWGAGGRGIIYAWEKLSLGVDFKYERAEPVMRWLAANGVTVQPRKNSKIRFREWQASLGFAYQVDIFYPYVSGRYANSTAWFKHLPQGFLVGTRQFKAENRRKFGMSLGCSLSNTSRFDATVEVRLIDEEGVTLAGEIKF